jgi:hypothetical protein
VPVNFVYNYPIRTTQKSKKIQDSTGQQAKTPKKYHGFWVDEMVKIVLGLM